MIVAFHELYGGGQAIGCVGGGERTGFFRHFFGSPDALVTPKAWSRSPLMGLPVFRIDRPPAPAIFDHELRRRPRVERCHVIAGVTSERRSYPVLGIRQIVSLPDIV